MVANDGLARPRITRNQVQRRFQKTTAEHSVKSSNAAGHALGRILLRQGAGLRKVGWRKSWVYDQAFRQVKRMSSRNVRLTPRLADFEKANVLATGH
jgi:hypothetical protein